TIAEDQIDFAGARLCAALTVNVPLAQPEIELTVLRMPVRKFAWRGVYLHLRDRRLVSGIRAQPLERRILLEQIREHRTLRGDLLDDRQSLLRPAARAVDTCNHSLRDRRLKSQGLRLFECSQRLGILPVMPQCISQPVPRKARLRLSPSQLAIKRRRFLPIL